MCFLDIRHCFHNESCISLFVKEKSFSLNRFRMSVVALDEIINKGLKTVLVSLSRDSKRLGRQWYNSFDE